MPNCTGADCFCKRPKAEHAPEPPDVIEVSLKHVPQITAYLDSIKGGDEDVLKMRLAEIRQEKWTKAEWNVFGIAARVALLNHSAYGIVLSAIQEMGGY
ncbi:MAG: hypothetical protein WA194_03075 [Patescibacteria group bacterium]